MNVIQNDIWDKKAMSQKTHGLKNIQKMRRAHNNDLT